MYNTCSCSDEIDPDYAHYLATYNPVEFESGICNCHPQYHGLIEEKFVEYNLKSIRWELTVSESLIHSKKLLVSLFQTL